MRVALAVAAIVCSLTAIVLVLAGCAAGTPQPVIRPAPPPTGLDCSGDQPTDPCIIQPEPTFP